MGSGIRQRARPNPVVTDTSCQERKMASRAGRAKVEKHSVTPERRPGFGTCTPVAASLTCAVTGSLSVHGFHARHPMAKYQECSICT